MVQMRMRCFIGGFHHVDELPEMISVWAWKLIDAFLYFLCPNDEKILWDKVCNGISDCPLSTDESICVKHDQHVSIGNRYNYVGTIFYCLKTSISLDLFNDNIPDCVTVNRSIIYEDEYRSESWLQSNVDPWLQDSHQYGVHQYHCQFDLDVNGHVVPYRDGRHLRVCAPVGCRSSQYKCPESYCLSIVRLCDGVRDCPYGEDEASCPPEGKPLLCPGMFKCKNGQCIHQDQVCDGKPDCPIGWEDERVCETPVCSRECRCLLKSMLCILLQYTSLNGSTFRHNYVFSYSIPMSYDGDTMVVFNFSTGWLTKVQPQSFTGVPNILTIDLSYNSIQTIHSYGFSNLHRLTRLILVGNMLRAIENYAFHQLFQLESLLLNQMKLKIIYGNALSHLTNLKELDLSDNKIKDIDLIFVDNCPGLKLLNITNNSLSYIRNQSVLTHDMKVYSEIGYICCHAECVSDLNNTVDCLATKPGPLFTSLACVLASISVIINTWNIRRKRIKAFSVTGPLIHSCITNILLDSHLLILAIKHLLIPDYYIGALRERICEVAALVQFIALIALPWFSSVQMHTMYSRLNTVFDKPWITIRNVIMVWIFSISICIILVNVPNTLHLSTPKISEHCSFLSQFPNIKLAGRLVVCSLILGCTISLILSVYFCLRIRCLVKASDVSFASAESKRFNIMKNPYHLVFKDVVLLPASAYLAVVGISIAAISGYTVPYMAHQIFLLTALLILSTIMSIHSMLKHTVTKLH